MIDKPGVYQVSADDYHADNFLPEPSLSASVANILLSQSPAHAFVAHARLNPNYAPEESDRFDLGSAAHALLLENDSSKITWIDAPDFRSGTARAAKIDARAHGKLPVLTKYQDVLHAMAKVARQAVAQSEFAGLFASGEPERTIVWKEGDVWCRSRLDWLSADRKIIFDYKTTTDASPKSFCRQLPSLGYHTQGAFYKRGLAALGHEASFFLLCQEIESPFSCSIVGLAEPLLQVAQSEIERAIRVWDMCIQSGQWPAYSLRTHYAEAPSWLLAEEEQRLIAESESEHL